MKRKKPFKKRVKNDVPFLIAGMTQRQFEVFYSQLCVGLCHACGSFGMATLDAKPNETARFACEDCGEIFALRLDG